MTTQPRTMTLEEFSVYEGDGPCDLINGELVTMAAGALHGMIASAIASELHQFVRSRKLGAVFVSETTFVLSAERVTAVRPDVAFLRRERIPPPAEISKDVPYPPDLAVEVISPSDRRGAIDRKLAAYREAGTPLVWLVDPLRHTVAVHALGAPVQLLAAGDTLDGGEVLPGFALPLDELFDL